MGREPKKAVFQEDKQMANMNRCSTSLISQKIQTEPTMRHCVTPIKMAFTKGQEINVGQ